MYHGMMPLQKNQCKRIQGIEHVINVCFPPFLGVTVHPGTIGILKQLLEVIVETYAEPGFGDTFISLVHSPDDGLKRITLGYSLDGGPKKYLEID